MGIQYTDINGQHISFPSTEIKVNGLYLPGVKMVSYKFTHDIAEVRGTGSHPLGRTRGTEKAEGSIELLKRWEKILLTMITMGWRDRLCRARLAHDGRLLRARPRRWMRPSTRWWACAFTAPRTTTRRGRTGSP
jgi:hypothetical protein